MCVPDEELVREAVRKGMQQEHLRRLAVAARSPRLLVVRLQCAGHGVVNDDAHVRLVDSHSEGIGGDNRADVAIHEGVLHIVPVRVVETGVVGQSRDAGLLERPRHLLDVLAGGRVHDGDALVLPENVDERRVLVRIRLGGDDVVAQIGAIESRDDRFGIVEPELPSDVGAHVLRGRRRESNHRGPAQPLAHLCDTQVAGTEVVTPFADAMRLVDG